MKSFKAAAILLLCVANGCVCQQCHQKECVLDGNAKFPARGAGAALVFLSPLTCHPDIGRIKEIEIYVGTRGLLGGDLPGKGDRIAIANDDGAYTALATQEISPCVHTQGVATELGDGFYFEAGQQGFLSLCGTISRDRVVVRLEPNSALPPHLPSVTYVTVKVTFR